MLTNTGLEAASTPGIAPVLDRCPRCAGGQLFTVFPEGRTQYLCGSCLRCWRVRSDGVERIDPRTCPGCEWRWNCTLREDAGTPVLSCGGH